MELDNQRFGSGYKEMYEAVKTVHLDQMMAAKWINEQIEEELARLAQKHYEVRTFTKELEVKFEEPAYEFLKVGWSGASRNWECEVGWKGALQQTQPLYKVRCSKAVEIWPYSLSKSFWTL